MEYDLLIINGNILPAAGADICTDGFIAVNGGIISRTGRMDELIEPLAHKVIDARDCLVMPGLINMHCHAAMSLFRGLADDLPLMSWLNEYIFPAESKYVNEEMVYWSSKLAAAEMIMSGTTMVADGYFFEEEAARAFQDAGIRASAAQGIIDFPAPGVPDPANNILTAESFLKQWQHNDLITPALFCHSPYTCSPTTIQKAKNLANEWGCKLYMHVAESREEVAQLKEAHGKTPVRHLYDLGSLDSNTICVHCVWLDSEEISMLKDSGTAVVTCPESNMKLAAGTAPVMELLSSNIPLGLGTDGCASNNNLDLFQEMNSLAKLHKLINNDPTAVSAKTALNIATQGAAKTLGLPSITGQLKINTVADIIVIDLKKPHLTPFYNADLLVYSAAGADVKTSIINGKVVMEDRLIHSFDISQVMEKMLELGNQTAGFFSQKTTPRKNLICQTTTKTKR